MPFKHHNILLFFINLVLNISVPKRSKKFHYKILDVVSRMLKVTGMLIVACHIPIGGRSPCKKSKTLVQGMYPSEVV